MTPIAWQGSRLIVTAVALGFTLHSPPRAQDKAAMPAPVPADWPGEWRLVTWPGQTLPVTQYRPDSSGGRPALRLEANGSYGHLLQTLAGNSATPARVRWSWRVDQAGSGINLHSRSGDDSPAKVCLSFDWPDAQVPFVERQLLRIARARSAQPLPGATLCWVWGGPEAPGDVVENPYTRRVRSIVLHSAGQVGAGWFSESRDVAQDLRLAFGDELPASEPLPAAAALFVGADADNTQGHSIAWIAGLRLE